MKSRQVLVDQATIVKAARRGTAIDYEQIVVDCNPVNERSDENRGCMLLLTRTIFAAIGFWLWALIILFVFPTLLPVVAGFAVLLSLPIAVVLMILTLFAWIQEKRRRWPVLGAALILAITFVALPRVMYWGALAHVYLYGQAYETRAKRMLAAQDEVAQRRICGEECWALSADQVGFHYVHGFLNWHDIIYDPTGKVLALSSWDEKKRFDMYFISAEHLTGDWYLGHFAD